MITLHCSAYESIDGDGCCSTVSDDRRDAKSYNSLTQRLHFLPLGIAANTTDCLGLETRDIAANSLTIAVCNHGRDKTHQI